MLLFTLCLKSCLQLQRLSLWKALFLASNVFTAAMVYITFFLSTNRVQPQKHQFINDDGIITLYAPSSPPSSLSSPSSPPSPLTTSVPRGATEIIIHRFRVNDRNSPFPTSKNNTSVIFCNVTTKTANRNAPEVKKVKKVKVHNTKLEEAGNEEVKVMMENVMLSEDKTDKLSKTSKNRTESSQREAFVSEDARPDSPVPVPVDKTDANEDRYIIPYVIGITPTYYRLTQKSDLTFLCQTLMNVPRLLWVVVEDANQTSEQVRTILGRCPVESVLMNVHTTKGSIMSVHRGMDQRNMALEWIRNRCGECKGHGMCEGVVYFMDDDNKYDIRLFERIRLTRGVSVFPVGLVAGLRFEGPLCKDEKVIRWEVQYAPKRHIPVDMAGFALNIRIIMNKPKVRIGFKPDQVKPSTRGYSEPDYLRSLGATRDMVECRGLPDEVLVWHVKTAYKPLIYEKKHPSDPKFKV